jgi:hypothetical protein
MASNFNIHSKNPPFSWGIFYFKSVLISGLLLIQFCTLAQAKIKFDDAKQSFGFVKKGEIVSLDYQFTNEGTEPLLISDAKVQCSCTTVDFPKQPIAPGQKNKITVKFDTKTVYDRQDRIVEIVSNAKDSPAKIRFKGFVQKK